MKKFFIVLSALAALMLCVVPAQALVGSPDDVPGSNAVVPFICDRSLTSGLNTLIVFQDVRGGWDTGGTATQFANVFHYNVNTVRSKTVINANLTGSPRSVLSTDLFTILTGKSASALSDLEVTINGANYYAGYIYFYNLEDGTVATNNLNSAIGQFFFVNLAVGKAASANIPMKEYARSALTTGGAAEIPATIIDWMVTNPLTARANTVNAQDNMMERFSPDALINARELQAGRTAPIGAVTFYTFPRIFVADATAENWWLLWTSANDLPTATDLHVDWYNENEKAESSNIPLNDELEIIDSSDYLPTGLWTGYPYSGYIDLNWTCSSAALDEMEFLGWSYLQATGTVNESWTVMNAIARDVE